MGKMVESAQSSKSWQTFRHWKERVHPRDGSLSAEPRSRTESKQTGTSSWLTAIPLQVGGYIGHGGCQWFGGKTLSACRLRHRLPVRKVEHSLGRPRVELSNRLDLFNSTSSRWSHHRQSSTQRSESNMAMLTRQWAVRSAQNTYLQVVNLVKLLHIDDTPLPASTGGLECCHTVRCSIIHQPQPLICWVRSAQTGIEVPLTSLQL